MQYGPIIIYRSYSVIIAGISELKSRHTDDHNANIEDQFISIIKSEAVHQWNELADHEQEIKNERKIAIDEAYEKLEERLGKLLDTKVLV